MSQNESFEEHSGQELEGAQGQIRELWGPEVEARLDQELAYDLTEVVGDLETSKEKLRVIIHYTPKRDFSELHQQFEIEVAGPRRKAQGDCSPEAELELEEGLEDEEFSMLEEEAENDARPLLNQLHEEGVKEEEHLRLGNAVVAYMTPALIKTFALRPGVRSIEADKPMKLELNETVPLIGVSEARSKGLVGTGKGIIVAVIDGEVDINHPDLKGRVVHKRNYTNEAFGVRGDEDTSAMHGTHVAGIIGGNGAIYKGVAPEVTIWSYKIYPSQKDESSEGSKGADAIEDAVKDGAHVINCSWGVAETPKDGTCTWCKTAERAATLGTVLVKSAGNSGPGQGSITCPAAAKGDVLVVGNAMRSGTGVMDRSSRGPTADGRIKPDVVAPGEKITAPKDSSGGGYIKLTGTSMAAPHVSGLAALILEKHKLLKPWQVKKALMDSATKVGDLDPNVQGSGLVNIVKAMEALKGGTGTGSTEGDKLSFVATLKPKPKQVETYSIAVKNITGVLMKYAKATLRSLDESLIKVTKAEANYHPVPPGVENTQDFEIEVVSGARSGPVDLELKVEFALESDDKPKLTIGTVKYEIGGSQKSSATVAGGS